MTQKPETATIEHQVRADFVGEQRCTRYTCHAPECAGASITYKPGMSSKEWNQRAGQFLLEHSNPPTPSKATESVSNG